MAFDQVMTLEGHENEVKCVAWNRSGSLLATCGRDKNIWVWEAITDTAAARYDEGMGGTGRATDDVDAFECNAVLYGHSQDVKCAKFHPSEDLIVSTSYDDSIKVWKEEEGGDWYCSDTLTGHSGTVWSVAFDASGRRFATSSDDCSIIIWELNLPVPPLPDPSVASSLLSFATGIWTKPKMDTSSSTPKYKRAATLSGYHDRTIYSLDWNRKSGRIVSGAADDCIRIFAETADSVPGAPSFELECTVAAAHAGDVNCVAWCNQAPTILASTGDDNLIKLWKYVSP